MTLDAGKSEDLIQVRVGVKRRNFAYVDFAKYRLYDGVSEVIISGLGRAISDAVAVAEILKNQGLVEVKKIATSRGNSKTSSTSFIDKIEIFLSKSKDFDTIFESQHKKKAEGATQQE